MAGVTWKMAVLLAVMVIFTILEFQMAEAQSTACIQQCATHAYCSQSFSGNASCRCRSGYHGNALTGSGNSGCRRRKLKAWKVIIAIIGALLGALLLFCLCLACIRKCLTRRKHRGPVVQQGAHANGYPQQAAYNQQGVPMGGYENNNQKVPGPAGMV